MLTTTAFTLGALRLPPFLTSAFAANDHLRAAGPASWPRELPPTANRPDHPGTEADAQLATPTRTPDAANAAPMLCPTGAPLACGWFDSSLDLQLGLQVQDLGPVEWLDEWDGAFV